MGKDSLRSIPCITELKAIAIVFIALTHYSQMFSTTHVDELLALGQMGCQLFLVVSCFTLSMSLEKKPLSYIQFVRRRFQRMAIPWWLTIIVYVVLGFGSLLVFNKNYFGTNIDPLSVLCNIIFLNGLIPFCNNNVVRGGWYIGTTVLLYLLHPLLFSIYRNSMKKNKKWVKAIYPLALFFLGFLVLNILSRILPDGIENNSFWYFNVLNQLACYSLGFVIFDYWKNDQFSKVSLPWTKCGVALLGGAVLFYSDWALAPLLIPFLFGIVSMYIIIALMQKKNKRITSKDTISEVLNRIGRLSFSVYLTHIFVVWYFTRAIKYVLGRFVSSELWMFFIILPVSFMLCYYVAILFNKLVGTIESLVYSKDKTFKS